MAAVGKDIFVEEYLARLQYTESVEPNLQTLNELHKRHLLTFPFENLNNVYQQPYASTKHDLFHKFIRGHRGGLCHENNTLFAFLLQDLGYDVTMCAASVLVGVQSFTTMGTHQLSIVELEGKQWIVDVGFGRSFIVPLRIREDIIQDGLNASYKLKKELNEDGELIVLWDKLNDPDNKEWQCQYKFTTRPRSISYFDPKRKEILEDPDSPFNQGLLCTILRPWGRLTLASKKLIKVYSEGQKPVKKEVEILNTREDIISAMDKEFGIKFDVQYSDRLDEVLEIIEDK